MKNSGLDFLCFFTLTVSWMLLMRRMTSPLDPGLIIDFEFIGTARNAVNFLSDLADVGQAELLTRSIFLDFIFPFLYGATLYNAIVWISNKLQQGYLFNRTKDVSMLTLTAVISDLLENLSLLRLIFFHPEDIYAYTAYLFAAIKFTLLGLVILYLIISVPIVIKTKQSELKR